MKNLKIGTRITIGFATILVLTVVVILYSIVMLEKLNSVSESMGGDPHKGTPHARVGLTHERKWNQD